MIMMYELHLKQWRKGTEIGRSFEELARIIDGVTHNDRLSICFDTCHTHDAGYNIKMILMAF